MKIIAPIRSAEQYAPLVRGGARELYGGIYSAEWGERYGELIEYNRRGSFGKAANFISFEELAQLLEWCSRDGVDFYLTANAIFLSHSQSDILEDMLRRYRQCGGSKVIVGDMQTLLLARDAGCEVAVSSCAGIYNSLTAKAFCDMGAKRLILPRSIDVSDIAPMRTLCPEGTEFEVFIMNTMCKYSDSFCRTLHNTSCGALCAFYDRRAKSYIDAQGNEICGKDAMQMQSASFFYRQLYTGNCSLGCGQCAIWDLVRAGVESVKIVGRLLDTTLLTRQIELTARNIELAQQVGSREEYFIKMEDSRQVVDADICSRGYRCYYRDIRRTV